MKRLIPAITLPFLPAVADTAGRLGGELAKLGEWRRLESSSLRWMIPTGIGILILACVGIFLIGQERKRRAEMSKQDWRLDVLKSVGEPVLVLIGTGAVFLLLLPPIRSMPKSDLFDLRLFLTLFGLCAAWGGLEMLAVFSRKTGTPAGGGTKLDVLMIEVTIKILKIGIICIGIIFILKNIFDLNVVPLLTGAGVAGLAIAFASRETLSNFFGTMVIIGDRPFRCGDSVRIGQTNGVVLDIGMRSTRVKTPDESVVLVPNSQIESAIIENISARGTMRYLFTVGLVYSTKPEDLKKAMEILRSITTDFHGKDTDRCKPRIFLDNLGASAINIKTVMWFKTASFRQEEDFRTEINAAVVEQFARANLIMAYNTGTQYVCGDPAQPIRIKLSRRE